VQAVARCAVENLSQFPSRSTVIVTNPILEQIGHVDLIRQNLSPATRVHVAVIPEAERSDMVRAYYKLLTSTDPHVVRKAAKTWSVWGGALSFLRLNPDYVAKFEEDEYAAAFARIECHYFIIRGFPRTENQLIEEVGKIRKIPSVIVQGRYDVVCPLRSAWDLHRAWPEANLRIVADAGHSAFEPGIIHELVAATDHFS